MNELTAGEMRYEERKVCAYPMNGGDTSRERGGGGGGG